jgi:hypothetical protein
MFSANYSGLVIHKGISGRYTPNVGPLRKTRIKCRAEFWSSAAGAFIFKKNKKWSVTNSLGPIITCRCSPSQHHHCYNLALTSVHILVLAIRVLNSSARPAIQGDIGAPGTMRTSDRAVGLRRQRKRKCTSSLNRALCGTPADIQR